MILSGLVSIISKDYHDLSRFEIGGGKRISLVSDYPTNQDLRHVRKEIRVAL